MHRLNKDCWAGHKCPSLPIIEQANISNHAVQVKICNNWRWVSEESHHFPPTNITDFPTTFLLYWIWIWTGPLLQGGGEGGGFKRRESEKNSQSAHARRGVPSGREAALHTVSSCWTPVIPIPMGGHLVKVQLLCLFLCSLGNKICYFCLWCVVLLSLDVFAQV